MSPEDPVDVVLADPVTAHVRAQVEPATGREPPVDGLARVRPHEDAVGGVGDRPGVILSARVAILRVCPCAVGVSRAGVVGLSRVSHRCKSLPSLAPDRPRRRMFAYRARDRV